MNTEKTIAIKGFIGFKNWGDDIAPILVEKISGVKPCVFPVKEKYNQNDPPHVYLTIGSILSFADSKTIVWGSGFRENETLSEIPHKICAVRGPLTRKKLLELGVSCPEVYGDPALLMPKFYQPKNLKKVKLGIIPHYVDQDNPWIKKIASNKDVKIIDIRGGHFDFIDQVYSCEYIASSSLHGIIVADAYGIPSTWLKLSNKIIGGNFKFDDYFASVGRNEETSLIVNPNTSINEIMANFKTYSLEIDLDKLIEACPLIEKY